MVLQLSLKSSGWTVYFNFTILFFGKDQLFNDRNLEQKQKMGNYVRILPFLILSFIQVTDKIVIQQMSGLMNNCCCYEGENMFEISDRLGHVILRAKEDSSCCYRQTCVNSYLCIYSQVSNKNVVCNKHVGWKKISKMISAWSLITYGQELSRLF